MTYKRQEKLDPILDSMDEKNSIKSKESIELELTLSELTQIRQNVINILAAIQANKSWFTLAAEFWGAKPWWAKLLMSIVVFLVTALIATAIVFMAQMLTLIAAAIVAAIFVAATILISYAIATLYLNNHYSTSQENYKELDKGILALTDLLANVISQLAYIHTQLVQEITRFQTENDNLSGNVLEFSRQLSDVQCKNARLETLKDALQKTTDLLNASSTKYENMVATYEISLKDNQELMQEKQTAYETHLKDLKHQINQLKHTKQDLESQLKILKATCQTLTEANNQIMGLEENAKLAHQAHINKLGTNLDERNQRITTEITNFSDTSNNIKDMANTFKETLQASHGMFAQANRQNNQLQNILQLPEEKDNRMNITQTY